jgi:cathepsin A (carboxypeptidase C)
MASEILSHKKRNINLKSIMIGNGLTDPLTQYAYYKPMACGEGGSPAILSPSECEAMDNALPRCQSLIQSCYDSESAWSCVPASIYCNNALIGPVQKTGVNLYDIRRPCKGSLCYEELDWISAYLNKKNVMEALGAEVDRYESCNMDINRNFLFQGHDWMMPYHRVVPDLLTQIPVLVYAGSVDFICNWLGNQAWVEALEWPGKKAYNKAPVKHYKTHDEGKVVGNIKSSGNLTFVEIDAAGHMVPYDQPEASLDMVNRWISGEWSKL